MGHQHRVRADRHRVVKGGAHPLDGRAASGDIGSAQPVSAANDTAYRYRASARFFCKQGRVSMDFKLQSIETEQSRARKLIGTPTD